MVRQLLPLFLAFVLVGCADEVEKNAVKSAPLTVDEQIKRIEALEGMPDDVKARTIENLKAQKAAREAGGTPPRS